MKKILSISLLLTLVIIVAGCKSKTATEERLEPEHVIESSDGKISIGIPEGALPSGMTKDDIKIESISANDFFSLPEGTKPSSNVTAYALEPSGAQFNKPLTVTIDVDLNDFDPSDFTVPLMLHGFEDEEEGYILDTLDNSYIEYDLENNKVVVSGDVNHFSNVAVDDEFGLFTGSISPDGGSYTLGNSFTFVISITDQEASYMTGRGISGANEPREVTVSVGIGTVSVFNTRGEIVRTRGYFTPQEVDRPATRVLAGDEYRFEQEYTCAQVGRDSFALVGGTGIRFTRQISVPRMRNPHETRVERDQQGTNIFLRTPSYACEEEQEFIMIGPQYFVVCPDATPITGYHKLDANGNPMSDAAGNPIDAETGQPVVCVGG